MHVTRQGRVSFVNDFQDEPKNAQAKICGSELILSNLLSDRFNGISNLLVKLLSFGLMLQYLVQDEICDDSCL